MAFSFGQKKSESPASSGNYLRNFRKGETKVRFLQEPGDWYDYREHFMDMKTFPCLKNEYCPGCKSDSEQTRRASRRYGTFVYNHDEKKVMPVKIGPRLSERLTIRAERNNGTLLSRDYTIIKSGSGMETDYDADQEEKYEFDTKEAWKNRGDQEVEDILEDQFTAVWGSPEEFMRNAQAEEKVMSEPKDTPVSGTKGSSEDPPFESARKAGDDKEISEDDLKAMTRAQLVKVWKEADFDGFDEDWGKADIVQAILERAS